jgi:hypothetical protein
MQSGSAHGSDQHRANIATGGLPARGLVLDIVCILRIQLVICELSIIQQPTSLAEHRSRTEVLDA